MAKSPAKSIVSRDFFERCQAAGYSPAETLLSYSRQYSEHIEALRVSIFVDETVPDGWTHSGSHQRGHLVEAKELFFGLVKDFLDSQSKLLPYEHARPTETIRVEGGDDMVARMAAGLARARDSVASGTDNDDNTESS